MAGVCTIQPLEPGGRRMTHVTLYRELPAGTQLYTASTLRATQAQEKSECAETQIASERRGSIR